MIFLKTPKHLILGLLVLSFGCSQPNQSNQEPVIDYEQLRKDSLAQIQAIQELKEQATKDSIAQIEQGKVIGEISFGMTESETKQAIKSFVKSCRRDIKMSGVYGVKNYPYYFIGNYEFNEGAIRTRYHDGKLWRFELGNQFIDWKKYDTEVRKEIVSISNVLKTKYGEPTVANLLPERHRTKEGEGYVINSWTIGTKEIVVYLDVNSTSYNVNLLIYQPAISDMLFKQRIESEASKTKDGSELF
jgi:hypothetical protein